MTSHSSTLSHPILAPFSYEKPDLETGFRGRPQPQHATLGNSSVDLPHCDASVNTSIPSPPRTKSMAKLMDFLKRKTKTPAAKMNALQAQQERERVELMDEYWTIAYYAVACLSVIFALTAIVVYWDKSIIKSAFMFPLITAPYAVAQRRQINKAAWLKEDFVRLQTQRSRLCQQNQRLQLHHDQLDLQVASLRAADRQLAAICQQQGGNVDQARHLVRENGEILRQMAQLEEARKLQHIVKMSLRSSPRNEMDEREVVQKLKTMSPRKRDGKMFFCNQSTSGGIYSLGSDPLEDMSEYEPFPRRRPSLE